jgi:hypothetical protein
MSGKAKKGGLSSLDDLTPRRNLPSRSVIPEWQRSEACSESKKVFRWWRSCSCSGSACSFNAYAETVAVYAFKSKGCSNWRC